MSIYYSVFDILGLEGKMIFSSIKIVLFHSRSLYYFMYDSLEVEKANKIKNKLFYAC